jgi:hypothetical protein
MSDYQVNDLNEFRVSGTIERFERFERPSLIPGL